MPAAAGLMELSRDATVFIRHYTPVASLSLPGPPHRLYVIFEFLFFALTAQIAARCSLLWSDVVMHRRFRVIGNFLIKSRDDIKTLFLLGNIVKVTRSQRNIVIFRTKYSESKLQNYKFFTFRCCSRLHFWYPSAYN